MRFRLMLTVLVAANADAACESGAQMGKQISFARRNPTMCSSNDAGSNDEVCTTLTIDASADGRETIKVNGGSKTYVASGLHIPKGAVFHVRTTGMEVKAKPVAWSVNSMYFRLPPDDTDHTCVPAGSPHLSARATMPPFHPGA